MECQRFLGRLASKVISLLPSTYASTAIPNNVVNSDENSYVRPTVTNRFKLSDDIIAKFAADMAAKKEAQRQFLQSDKCKSMISSVIAYGQELDIQDIHYDLYGIRARYGWEMKDISKEDIEMFCSAMIDSLNGTDSFISQLDNENPFSHSYHLKCGLIVFSMHGQGSIYVISPPAVLPEVHQKLLAAMPLRAENPKTESDAIAALKPKWTPEFLELLAETARVVGWNCDHIATMDFVEQVFAFAGVECPDVNAHEYDEEPQ